MRWMAMIAALAAMASSPASAQSVENFYRGKTISMVIGFSVGGGYDIYARLLGRHMGKHIPGNPTIVPQNMTGAGSLRAALYLYSAAPKDGTTLGAFGRTAAVTPLLQPAATPPFDGTKLTWLGSMTNDTSVCVTWHTSQIKTWEDFLAKPSVFGGEGPGGDPDVFALLYRNVFGAKVRLVTGYHGTAEITLAMERGEVDGLCGISWSTLKSRHDAWLRDKKLNILVQAAARKEPALGAVPLITDHATPEQQRLLKFILVTQEMARPIAAAPDIPADRKAALIAAFDKTLADPEFLAEAAKLRLDINPVPGKALDTMLAELYASPKDIIDKAAAAIAK